MAVFNTKLKIEFIITFLSKGASMHLPLCTAVLYTYIYVPSSASLIPIKFSNKLLMFSSALVLKTGKNRKKSRRCWWTRNSTK